MGHESLDLVFGVLALQIGALSSLRLLKDAVFYIGESTPHACVLVERQLHIGKWNFVL